MELHALKLSLTEQDLNELLRKYIPKDADVEDLRVKPYAHRHLARPGVTQPHHVCQLFIGQTRDVFEVNARVVYHRLAPGNSA